MAERTVVEGLAGAVVSITAVMPNTYDQAGYEASGMNYIQIGQVENQGNHGVTAAVTEFTPIDTAVVAKIKGSKNYGNMSLSLGCLPSDAGQDIVEVAAEATNTHYSVRIVYPDTSKHYLDVLVTKFEWVDGSVNDVRKINTEFAICRRPVVVAQL